MPFYALLALLGAAGVIALVYKRRSGPVDYTLEAKALATRIIEIATQLGPGWTGTREGAQLIRSFQLAANKAANLPIDLVPLQVSGEPDDRTLTAVRWYTRSDRQDSE